MRQGLSVTILDRADQAGLKGMSMGDLVLAKSGLREVGGAKRAYDNG